MRALDSSAFHPSSPEITLNFLEKQMAPLRLVTHCCSIVSSLHAELPASLPAGPDSLPSTWVSV